jgi:hypothetical protein
MDPETSAHDPAATLDCCKVKPPPVHEIIALSPESVMWSFGGGGPALGYA